MSIKIDARSVCVRAEDALRFAEGRRLPEELAANGRLTPREGTRDPADVA